MSELDVIEQLQHYGGWLSTRLATDLAAVATDATPDLDDGGLLVLEPADHRNGSLRGRRPAGWVLAAAAAAALVLVVGFALTREADSDSEARGSADTPAESVADRDPPGALFMVPIEPGPPADSSAWTTTSPFDELPAYIVVGDRQGNAYGNLISVAVRSSEPDGDWTTVETPSGPARRSRGDAPGVVTLAVPRDDRWIVVTTRTEHEPRAIDLLAHLSLDGQEPEVDDEGATVITRSAARDAETLFGTGFESTPGPLPITVETSSGPSGLIAVSNLGGELSPVEVRGVTGWRLRRDEPDGEWNGVTWQETPDRFVAVSGVAPIDQIVTLAESLRQVDETTWREVFPYATTG